MFARIAAALAALPLAGPAALAGDIPGNTSTTAVITPGGVGITETGTLALLLSFGAPAPQATAGVLLFAAFAYALEIPLGGLTWVVVLTCRHHRAPRTGEKAEQGAWHDHPDIQPPAW